MKSFKRIQPKIEFTVTAQNMKGEPITKHQLAEVLLGIEQQINLMIPERVVPDIQASVRVHIAVPKD